MPPPFSTKTMMKDKTLTTLLFIGTVVMMFLLGVMYYQDKTLSKYRNILENIDTTTVTKTDTVYQTKVYTDTIPKYVTRWKTKTDTLYKENDSVPHVITLNTKTFENTLTDNNDTLHYQAIVTGYDKDNEDYPRLDSIRWILSHQMIQTNTTTTQVIKVPQKASKWHLTPSIGTGYGLVNKQCDVYLGISLGYSIFK